MSMKIHKIEKQKLLHAPLSIEALKLARAIYYTHLKDDENLFLEVTVKSILSLLKLPLVETSKARLIEIFEELNEPLAVKDFKYIVTTYPMRFVNFCEYKIIEDMVTIELSEEFLYAEKEYMIDNFLTN